MLTLEGVEGRCYAVICFKGFCCCVVGYRRLANVFARGAAPGS